MPPPTMTIGIRMVCLVTANAARSRSLWPGSWPSSMKPPAMERPAFGERPTRAALKNWRRVGPLANARGSEGITGSNRNRAASSMRDLAPVVLVVADQHLIVQAVGLGIHGQHIVGKL